MVEYRNCECHACYRLVPKPTAHKLTIERETGRSGDSVRFSKNSTSYSTGRPYYRKQDVWLCADCFRLYQAAKEKRKTRRTIIAGGAVAAAILIFIVGNTDRSATHRSADTVQTSWPAQSENAAANFVRPSASAKTTAPEKDVHQIQSRLVELGYLAATPNGIWGPKTRGALTTFKAANGLPADDTWDDATGKRLFSKTAARALLPVADAVPRR